VELANESRSHTSCPLCGGADLNNMWEVNGYTITKCRKCSLVFVLNYVTTEELIAHYGAMNDDSYGDNNVDCLNYYYEALGGLIRKRFPQGGRILDIGCSRGWFLDTMEGWECHGNEITDTYGKAAREKHGDQISIGPFEEYPMREGYFDVITLQDVFDHIREPLDVLKKCYRLLRPGGLIAIKVHNISCLYAKVTGKRFYAVIPPSHLFYYDKATLGRTLEKSGFQVVDSKFIGHLFKIKTIFLRLSRDNVNSRQFRAYQALKGTALGEFQFKKNLHDIITMLAVKPA
jgi:2-polyprenyl-3-methyl-5-hydroxy-6-metoxy-1,4-benzoquinol methylase